MVRNPKFEVRDPKEARSPNAESKAQRFRDPFGFRASDFFRISDFGSRNSSSWLHRKRLLLLGFLGLLLPLLDAAFHSPEGEKLFLVVNHFLPREPLEGVILLQKNGFFRANFLAIAAEDATQHVGLEFLRHLFRVRPVGNGPYRARR